MLGWVLPHAEGSKDCLVQDHDSTARAEQQRASVKLLPTHCGGPKANTRCVKQTLVSDKSISATSTDGKPKERRIAFDDMPGTSSVCKNLMIRDKMETSLSSAIQSCGRKGQTSSTCATSGSQSKSSVAAAPIPVEVST